MCSCVSPGESNQSLAVGQVDAGTAGISFFQASSVLGKASSVLGSQELPSKQFLSSAFNSQINLAEQLCLGTVTLSLVLRLV